MPFAIECRVFVLLCSYQQWTNLSPEMGLISGHLPEIVILLVVVLIIWGPGKLPDIGAAMGKGISEFRKASSEPQDAAPGTTSTATPAQPALTQASESVIVRADGTTRQAPVSD